MIFYLLFFFLFRLYNKILDRLQSDLGSAAELFTSVLTALWAARDGLSEHEIKSLFDSQVFFYSCDYFNHILTYFKKYTEQIWKRVFQSIQRFIVNICGLESLSNSHIREAVEHNYPIFLKKNNI